MFASYRSPFRRLTALTATAAAVLGIFAGPGQAASSHPIALRPAGAHASIIGGYTPHPSQWPWMAALTVAPALRPGTTDMDRRFCGGGLIAPRLVLTAAHCVTEKDGSQSAPSTIQVVLGKRDLAAGGGEHLDVQAIERHPAWDRKAIRHDLALLYLSAPSVATPAALVWPGSQIPANTLMTVMGWGRIHVGVSDRTASSSLKALDQRLLSDTDCAAATTAWSGDSTLYDPATQLCASPGDNAQATCKGDSGGPLMFLDSTNTWRLFGVVSYGTGDCSPVNAPDVFAWLGADDMLSFVTRGISTANDLPAPVSAPTTPNPNPNATPTPTPSPAGGSDRTAPAVHGLGVNPRVVRSGRKMYVHVSVGEGGTMRMKLRGPDGAWVAGTARVEAGAHVFSAPARVGRHNMRTGRWTVTVTVVDAAGNRSRSARAGFRVVR